MSEALFKPIYGRCECGGVRYKVTAPAWELYHCHCSRCRRLHGALFATYAYIERVQLVIEEGAENMASYSSSLADWRFCRNCGCHLFAEHRQNPGAMWYMPATLEEDSEPGHPEGSEKHIFVGSKSSLETITDDLPQFEEYAPPALSVTSRKSPCDV